MPEVKKFEPEKISAALKRLRALPVKDNSKSLTEALVMLSDGIQAAIAKGYSRRAIQNILVESGVAISTTSLNNFLSGEQKKIKEASQKQKPKNMEASMEQAANTKDMGGEQQKLTPENSNGLLEKQEREKMTASTSAV